MGLAHADAARVQSAAIAGLCESDISTAARLASENFARLSDETALTEVFFAFLRHEGGAGTLADALLVKIPPKEAATVGLRLLSSSGRRDERLTRILTEAAGFRRQEKQIGDAVDFVGEVRARGDAKHGAEIFRRQELGCIACHIVNGEGGKIGPDLSALGTAQPIDFIVGAILDPQREVKEGYISISVTTSDGEEYQGYAVRETEKELVMRDILQDKEVHLRRDMIKEKKQNGSVMPSGLADLLTRSEFRDLVRFLSELGASK